jgi:hypothetical protein
MQDTTMRGYIVHYDTPGTTIRGILTVEHAASSYGQPVFVPIDENNEPTGAAARGVAEVGPLTGVDFWDTEKPNTRRTSGKGGYLNDADARQAIGYAIKQAGWAFVQHV